VFDYPEAHNHSRTIMDTASNETQSQPLTGFWYAALLSSDVRPGQMKAQTLAGLPLVICRDRQGRVAALRDICPHRAMPLSFGCFDGERIECSYHGWQFDTTGRCREIPALVADSGVQPEKIGVTTYPAKERDGYVWVYVPGKQGVPTGLPEPPALPVLSESYRTLHISMLLTSTIDNGLVGLIDPAHGPFVHRSPWWRSRATIREKSKAYEPLPLGFRMVSHPASSNSSVYKLVGLSGGAPTVTIDFLLPNIRIETIQSGSQWFLSRTMITPISDTQCRMDFCAAWDCLRWLPFSKTLLRLFGRAFIHQDTTVMARQAIGLRHDPPMMLLGDPDLPAKWYIKLKAAYLAAEQNGGALDHPLKGPITLRWRT